MLSIIVYLLCNGGLACNKKLLGFHQFLYFFKIPLNLDISKKNFYRFNILKKSNYLWNWKCTPIFIKYFPHFFPYIIGWYPTCKQIFSHAHLFLYCRLFINVFLFHMLGELSGSLWLISKVFIFVNIGTIEATCKRKLCCFLSLWYHLQPLYVLYLLE
jgi:hypothetical protein